MLDWIKSDKNTGVGVKKTELSRGMKIARPCSLLEG